MSEKKNTRLSKMRPISYYEKHERIVEKAKHLHADQGLKFNLSEFVRFCLGKQNLLENFQKEKQNGERY